MEPDAMVGLTRRTTPGAHVADLDMGRFFVNDIIVHEIPKRYASEGAAQLDLSQFIVDVGDEVRNFFKERITTTITKFGVDVYLDDKHDDRAPNWIRQYLLDGGCDLVAMSQDMAEHLYHQQQGVQPVGLLVVATGALAGKDALVIMKLQKEEGARVRRTTVDGQTSLNVEHLRELMLTARTRVFKAGFFHLGKDNQVLGYVSDEQVKDFADFFLHRFLGCSLARRPAQVTKEFHAVTSRFINDRVTDPDSKWMLHEALQVELRSNKDSLRPRDFIKEHVPEDFWADLEEELGANEIPLETFPKDTARLTPRQLTTTRAKTARGIVVTGNSETFNEIVEPKVIEGKKVTVIDDLIVSYDP